jgi:hypothetical protein
MPSTRRSSPANVEQSTPQKIWQHAANGTLEPTPDDFVYPVYQEIPVKSDEDEANPDDEQLSAQGYVPHAELYGGLWSNVSLATLLTLLI